MESQASQLEFWARIFYWISVVAIGGICVFSESYKKLWKTFTAVLLITLSVWFMMYAVDHKHYTFLVVIFGFVLIAFIALKLTDVLEGKFWRVKLYPCFFIPLYLAASFKVCAMREPGEHLFLKDVFLLLLWVPLWLLFRKFGALVITKFFTIPPKKWGGVGQDDYFDD